LTFNYFTAVVGSIVGQLAVMAAFETQQKDRMSPDYAAKGAILPIPRIRHILREFLI